MACRGVLYGRCLGRCSSRVAAPVPVPLTLFPYTPIHSTIHTTDPAYAEELLLHARRLFDFAYKHQAMCQVSSPYYQSTGYIDELAYSAGKHDCWCVCTVCMSWVFW